MKDVLLDALLDSLKMLPFLIVIYIVIELFEEKTVKFFKNKHSKNMGPLLGAGFGLIPQCGFGVVTTKLFSKRYITIGTLIAIYVATSDEAIPMIIANPQKIGILLPFILIKVGYAILLGYFIDLILRKREIKEKIEEDEHVQGCCGHEVGEKKGFKEILVHPLLHSLKLFAYILIINIAFGVLIFYVGEENIKSFLEKSIFLQPLLATFIGLIPNCAASVLITEMYLSGLLTFGACLAGLTANNGIAVAILFKENKNIKENFSILGFMLFSGLLIGYLVTLVMTFIL